MELPNIGQQCAVLHCKQLDFLPFVCNCKLVFCREHFLEHQDTCPNKVEDRKIDVEKRIPSYECSENGCKEKSIVPLLCTKCNKHFCIAHRHTLGSGCEKIDEVQLQKAIEKCNAPKTQFQEAKHIVDNEVQKTLNKARRKEKNVETANKVQLMRLKAKATGLKNIPIVDRIYFLIFNDKYCPDGRAVYISSDWSVGRSIDAIAEELANIDYGIPLDYTTPDYRTSTLVGLRYHPSVRQEFYNLKAPTFGGIHLAVKQANYKTQNDRTYDHKYHRWNNSGYPELAVPLGKVHYMRDVKEKIFKNPPPPRKFEVGEYNSQYVQKHSDNSIYPPPKLASKVFCQISSMGREEQPRIKVEEGGVIKQLDNYMTTTQMSYVPFSKKEVSDAKTFIVTVNDKDNPMINLSKTKKQLIYDTYQFKTPVQDRIVPKLVFPVPFSGQTSEYASRYRSPTIGCWWSHTFDSGVDFEDSLSAPSNFQNLAAPNMYCTEYCHIGTGIPVCASVNPKFDKPEYKHDGCYK